MEKLKSFPAGTVIYSINDFHLDNGTVAFNFPTCSLAQLTRTNPSEWGYISIFKSKGSDKSVRYIDSEPAYFFDTVPDELTETEFNTSRPLIYPTLSPRTELPPRTEFPQISTVRTTRTMNSQSESSIVAEDMRTYVSTPKSVSFVEPESEEPISYTVTRNPTVSRTIPERPSTGSLRTIPVQTIGRTSQTTSETIPVRQITSDLIQKYKPICSEIYYSRFFVENPDDFVPVCQYAVNMNELKEYLKNLNITESIKYLRIMSRDQEIGLVQTFMPTVDWFYASS